MTSACMDGEKIQITLSGSEALVLFEWLSRNWENTHWENSNLFSDPAEKQMLIWLENDLEKLLDVTFSPEYREILIKAYRKIVPDPLEWE